MKNLEAYSRQQVKQLIIGLLMFSNANDNQGLTKIIGLTFGEKADSIINALNYKLTRESLQNKLLAELFPTK